MTSEDKGVPILAGTSLVLDKTTGLVSNGLKELLNDLFIILTFFLQKSIPNLWIDEQSGSFQNTSYGVYKKTNSSKYTSTIISILIIKKNRRMCGFLYRTLIIALPRGKKDSALEYWIQ